jgi:hypothetical protein
MIRALEMLRDKDTAIVRGGMEELLAYCNSSTTGGDSEIQAIGHILKQKAGAEVSIEFAFIAATTAAADSTGDLCLYNPMLSPLDADGLSCAAMLLMMTANRVTHAILALQQARGLLKVLKQMHTIVINPEESSTLQAAGLERLQKEVLTQSDNLAVTLAMRRDYTVTSGPGLFEIDPRFLLFEFCHGLLLRPSQVQLVTKLLAEMEAGHSVCHQMIMGAGKTTVVGPLLAMLLANSSTLMIEVVPPALLDFSVGVLREKFSAAVRKPVFTFTFDRYTKVTPQLLSKLKTARNLRAIVVSSPSSVKSFMLKFIEICHNLSRQNNLVLEKKEKKSVAKFSLRALLGFQDDRVSSGEMSAEDIVLAREQVIICDKMLEIFKSSIEIMDEVDVILHPLKSELNWPLGLKEPLDFTRARAGNGLRWGIPGHLFDAIFSCCGMPILADIAESKAAVVILDKLEKVIQLGFKSLQLQRSPHLSLVSTNFYTENMKPILAEWLLLWLRARKLPALDDEEVIEFLMKGVSSSKLVTHKVRSVLGDDHVKMLNLGHDWLQAFLPFCLQKVNRVHFGLLQPGDIQQLEDDGVKIPTSRKLTAVYI